MADVDLTTIVQRMKDAGESEANIGSVIREYNARRPIQNITKVDSSEPDTFMGGFKKSLQSGEAWDAGMKGAIGYGKGAIMDLPSTAMSMMKDAYHTVNPIDQFMGTIQGAQHLYEHPTDPANYIPGYDAFKSMFHTTEQAGADPEAFGRMMGNVTGQPLATEGLVKAAPMVGPAVEGTGRVMRRYQPVSGLMPRIAELRTMRNIEAGIGGGLERLGQRLQIPTRQGEVMYPHSPTWVEGETVPHDTTSMTGPYKQATPIDSASLPTDVHSRGSMPINMPPTLPEFSGNRLPPSTSPITTQSGYPLPHLQIEAPPNFEPPAQNIGTATPSGPTKPRVAMKSGMAFEVPQGQISRDFLKKAKAQGFDFAELTSEGNFRFEKK